MTTNNGKTLSGPPGGLAKVVKEHYNNLQEKGIDARRESRIIHMRSFNNWIKSILIGEALSQVRRDKPPNYPVVVLDVGCGKGGDLQKYRIGRISHLICTDIADESLKQCADRYDEMRARNRPRFSGDRQSSNIFTTEYVVADSTRDRLRDKYEDPDRLIDLVSIQFVFHYCFESLPQAERMIRNISENLKPRGFWIGTTPNSFEIVRRAREANSLTYGNDVYQISFKDERILDPDYTPPLFGCTYTFKLDDCVVDCPEFLVYFPAVEKIARKYGLVPCFKKTFEEYFHENKDKEEGRRLLKRMNVFQSFPPLNDPLGVSAPPGQYEEAEEFIKRHHLRTVGTISKAEWEAITLYTVFAFIKVGPIEEDDDPETRRKKLRKQL